MNGLVTGALLMGYLIVALYFPPLLGRLERPPLRPLLPRLRPPRHPAHRPRPHRQHHGRPDRLLPPPPGAFVVIVVAIVDNRR